LISRRKSGILSSVRTVADLIEKVAPMNALPTFRGSQPLSLDQLRAAAPSVFAEAPHSSRSDKYVYLPTSVIVEALMHEGFQPVRAQESRTRIEDRRGFTKHLVAFRHPDLRPSKVGDVFPEVKLKNAHDGSAALEGMLGWWRLACLNGLTMPERDTTQFKVRHSGKVIDDVKTGAFMLIEQVRRIGDVAEQWRDLPLTGDERMAFAEAAHELRFPSDDTGAQPAIAGAIDPAKFLEARRVEDRGSDLWRVFNVVQENVTKGDLKGQVIDPETHQRRRVRTRPINGIEQDTALNRALWILGERMAELKGIKAAA
jgi:hypothetical protein